MKADFTSRLKQRLANRWRCDKPIGLSDSEIDEYLRFAKCEVGCIYRAFLSTCGVECGDLFFDYNWRPNQLESQNRRLVEYSGYAGVSVPDRIFAFLDFIGDYFWCFQFGEDDPDVIMFDNSEYSPIGYKLSDFLVNWEQHERPDS